MKILYDHQMFSLQNVGGITRYFSDLITNHASDVTVDFPILYSENQYLKEADFGLRSFDWPKSFRIRRRIYYFLNQKQSVNAIRRNDFDLFHPTYYSTYFLDKLKKPYVLTVHDMIHEKYKNYFSSYDRTAEHKRILIKNASRIIAVSENTKKDIVDLLHVDPEKVSVVYHGYEQKIKPTAQLFRNYILFVGDRRGYKNFSFLLESILPLLKENKELSVVCTGSPFTPEEMMSFKARSIEGQMHHICATDAQLASLYKYASVFVYPSLYEGFGIPILEAFYNNCPVCLSNTSCFPEIGGDAALYFDPVDKESLLHAVKSVLENESIADSLRIKGNIRKANFSIKQMVENTTAVYSDLIK